jgi:uncharacterized protein YjbI with pentapeptide repeats
MARRGSQEVVPVGRATSDRRWFAGSRSPAGVITLTLIGLSLAFAALALILSVQGRGSDRRQPLAGMSREQLEAEKVRQEIRNLESERSLLRSLPSYAAILTAVGALSGFFVNLRAQRRERQSETLRRFDENFHTVIANLGSDSLAVQASAAVSLMTFLRPEYSDFYEQIYLVTLANLKVPYEDEINRLLTRTFAVVLERLEGPGGKRRPDLELDLSRTRLERIDLSQRDLSQADLAKAVMKRAVLREANMTRAQGFDVDLEGAILERANLREARLDKAHCRGAVFYNARMSPCWLERADLREAKFQGAQLQAAHLENAVLLGARFEGANLNDTYFCGAKFDEAALGTIKRAVNWTNAHFNKANAAQLQKMTGQMPKVCPGAHRQTGGRADRGSSGK